MRGPAGCRLIKRRKAGWDGGENPRESGGAKLVRWGWAVVMREHQAEGSLIDTCGPTSNRGISHKSKSQLLTAKVHYGERFAEGRVSNTITRLESRVACFVLGADLCKVILYARVKVGRWGEESGSIGIIILERTKDVNREGVATM